jgi:uncharacterized membrane protein
MEGIYLHLYTDRVRRVLFYAFRQAAAFNHREIMSTDLLFGLLHEGQFLFMKRRLSNKKLTAME